MPKSNRLNGSTEGIDLGFVERGRAPREIIETSIQLYLAELSLSNTKQYLERSKTQNLFVFKYVQKPETTAVESWLRAPTVC